MDNKPMDSERLTGTAGTTEIPDLARGRLWHTSKPSREPCVTVRHEWFHAVGGDYNNLRQCRLCLEEERWDSAPKPANVKYHGWRVPDSERERTWILEAYDPGAPRDIGEHPHLWVHGWVHGANKRLCMTCGRIERGATMSDYIPLQQQNRVNAQEQVNNVAYIAKLSQLSNVLAQQSPQKLIAAPTLEEKPAPPVPTFTTPDEAWASEAFRMAYYGFTDRRQLSGEQ